MATDVLGGRVADVVEPVRDRVAQIRRGERVVDRCGHARVTANGSERIEVRDGHVRVGDRLDVEECGPCQRCLHRIEIVRVDERDLDTTARKHVRREAVGAAVELGAHHDPVARPRGDTENCVDRGHARREAERGIGALERGHLLLERGDRRVPISTGVGVAGRLEGDRVGIGFGVGEAERRRLVERHARRLLIDRRHRAVHRPRREPALMGHGLEPTRRRTTASGTRRAAPRPSR